MDTTLAIIQTIAIAGLSALISYWVSTRQKKLDFRYDYRKYILNKRKEAYNVIEELINKLRNVDNRNYSSSDASKLSKLISKVTSSMKAVIWSSPELNYQLNELQHFFIEILLYKAGNDFEQGQEMSEEDLKKFWGTFRSHHERFEKHLEKIEDVFFEDLTKLDEIDVFIGHYKSREPKKQALMEEKLESWRLEKKESSL